MSDIAVLVRDLGKKYRLGALDPYRTLRDSLVEALRGRRGAAQRREEIWALRDVSFDVRQGEVLGVIGRNGAGKSTLLKILSRVTYPDKGSVELVGRVGALLEVGTGFHPELTGRENIFMNGTILGMRRREIEARFDEIVAFSGVEEFLDTPVKRYSSGMRVRLGFAVAAHFEPEILVVDEVLAVGDAEFQRRCLGRMQQVAGKGRTVLFVSHQMEAIQSLCSRAVWLQDGTMVKDGLADEVVSAYLSATLAGDAETQLAARTDRSGKGDYRFSEITATGGDGQAIRTGAAAVFRCTAMLRQPSSGQGQLMARLAIRDHMDRVLVLMSNEMTQTVLAWRAEETRFECEVDRVALIPGQYTLDVSLWVDGVLQDKVNRTCSFEVLPGDFHGAGRAIHVGSFHLPQSWRMRS